MLFDGLRWIFFDMGSTLIDETDSYRGWFQNASDAVGGTISAREIARGYAEGMAHYTPTIVGQLRPYGYAGDSAAPLYPHAMERPYPQAKPLLARLSQTYKLAVIANQSTGTENRLAHYGLLPYFTFVLGSDDVGFKKPDPQIFRLALQKAGCAPREALMIGDRPDNDIYPAKRLGLRTLRVQQGPAACQLPRAPEYEADATVKSLGEIPSYFSFEKEK